MVAKDINALHQKARQGNLVAESELFRILSVRFRHFAYQRIGDEESARDVVQETVMLIAHEYRGIDFKASFSAWAYNVLINKIRNYRRTAKRRGSILDQEQDRAAQSFDGSADPVLETRLLECLKKICRSNQRYARVLNLKYQGYLVDEIRSRLELSANNLYVLLSRARSMLRRCLETGELNDE